MGESVAGVWPCIEARIKDKERMVIPSQSATTGAKWEYENDVSLSHWV